MPAFIVQHIDWAPCINDYSFYLDCCTQFWPALTGLNQPLLFKPALQFQLSCYLNALFEPTIQPSGALHLVYLSYEASSSFLSYFKAKWMRKFVTGWHTSLWGQEKILSLVLINAFHVSVNQQLFRLHHDTGNSLAVGVNSRPILITNILTLLICIISILMLPIRFRFGIEIGFGYDNGLHLEPQLQVLITDNNNN